MNREISDRGQKIRVILAQKGKRQAWLAEQLGWTPQRLSEFLRQATAQGPTLKRIADVLEVNAGELV